MDLLIRPHILAVGIACQTRMDEGMIEMRIELGDTAFVLTIHLNATQIIIPFVLCTFHDLIEIPSQIVSFQVFSGIFYGNIR